LRTATDLAVLLMEQQRHRRVLAALSKLYLDARKFLGHYLE